MENCLFCKIANKEIGSMVVYEDEELMAFKDIDPKAPLHLLIIPKAHIDSAQQLSEENGPMLGRVFALAARLCQQEGYSNGYRLVTNVGEEGGQSVQHLHFHLLAGRQMAWPPG